MSNIKKADLTATEKILYFLSGKKSTAIAFIALIIEFLEVSKVIDSNMTMTLLIALSIIAGGGNFATNRMYQKYAPKDEFIKKDLP